MRAVVVAVVVVVAAACGSDGGGNGGDGSSSRPSSPAKVRIVKPEPGEVVPGPTVHVSVELTGARVIDKATTDVKPDEGHIHLSVDGKVVSFLAGTESDLADLAAGTHVLQVEFVAGDHAPFSPRVAQQTTFSVQ